MSALELCFHGMPLPFLPLLGHSSFVPRVAAPSPGLSTSLYIYVCVCVCVYVCVCVCVSLSMIRMEALVYVCVCVCMYGLCKLCPPPPSFSVCYTCLSILEGSFASW